MRATVADDEARLRSQAWFDNPDDPPATALYIERYLNFGLTRDELQSGRPIIGIAQSGSISILQPASPRTGEAGPRRITANGGIAFEFPTHPIQETGKRPTAAVDRNLATSRWSRCCTGIRSTEWSSRPAVTRPRRPC
ncbi:MAG: hypothetical protein R2710_05450 [Acidimicrobiales bacterium]